MKPSQLVASPTYQLLMLVLCVYAIAAIALTAVVKVHPEVALVLDYADFLVCAIFFVDFLLSCWQAERPVQYFFTWGWLDLLSSIPTLDPTRWGRLARIVRVFRLLRGLRATKVLTGTILRDRAQKGILSVSLAAVLLIVFCSAAVLHFETVESANIKTAEDAIWWSLTTITTVGYGDHYPVTTEGRVIAVLLMGAGVGLFSTFSGLLAAWFLSPGAETDESDIAALRREIAALRKAIEGSNQGP